MNLNIGLPIVEERVDLQFFLSFLGLTARSFTLLVPVWASGRMAENIASARNSLVRQAFDNDATHLLMMDTDQIYPPDCIDKLISHDKDMASVRVHRRWPPFEVIMNRGEIGKYKHVSDKECFSGDLVEIDATGTACMLIKMEVFEALSDPWFYLKNGSKSPHNRHGKPVGEDIRFCSDAKAAGFDIFVDTSIEVGHISKMVINRSFYEIYKAVKGYKWNKEEKQNGS